MIPTWRNTMLQSAFTWLQFRATVIFGFNDTNWLIQSNWDMWLIVFKYLISSPNNILGLSPLSFREHSPLKDFESSESLLCFLSLRKHVLCFCLALSASLIPPRTRVTTECSVLRWPGCFCAWRQLRYQHYMCLRRFPVRLRHRHVYRQQRTGSHPIGTWTPHPPLHSQFSTPLA